MLKKVLILSILFSLTTYSNNNIEIENRRNEQADFDSLIKAQDFNTSENNNENIDKDVRIDIASINVEGNTLFEDFQLDSFFNRYIGRNRNIYAVMKDLENKYIEKGYVTTKVRLDINKSDFEVGKISLFVSEGKIGKVFFDDKENKLKTFITFPQRENNLLNIRDLDQGIDNLGNNIKLDIKPSDEEEYSDVYIKRDNKYISLGLNYNDLGQVTTSRHRFKYFLNTHNILGLNESIDFSHQKKLQRQYKEKDANNFSFGISIPFKYWSFYYGYDNSDYLRTIKALNRKYRATGRTENQTFGLRKVITRDKNYKLDIGAKIVLKDSKNYLDDIRLISSTRKLSVLTVDTSYTGRIYGSLLNVNAGISFGLKRFGANKDNEELFRDEDSPKAQFRKYNLNISFYKPIKDFYYKTFIGGQYSKDILYSQEKLGIGDDTTVRGFKDESSQGDKGFYLRNEIGYKGNEFLEPYIAYDYGRVFNNKVDYDKVETLQGVSVGTKIYFKGFEGNIAISKPIDRPEYFKNNKAVIYTSLTYRF